MMDMSLSDHIKALLIDRSFWEVKFKKILRRKLEMWKKEPVMKF